MLLNPVGITINPKRPPADDQWDDGQWTDLPPIHNAVPALTAPAAAVDDGGRPYTQSGSVYVPRGSDLRDGDRFTLQDRSFGVVGNAMWDMNHPFTGADFGYVEYAIRLGG